MEDTTLEPRPLPNGKDVGMGEEADHPHGPARPQGRQASGVQARSEAAAAAAPGDSKSTGDRTHNRTWAEEGV